MSGVSLCPVIGTDEIVNGGSSGRGVYRECLLITLSDISDKLP